jgi:hypothetical protein
MGAQTGQCDQMWLMSDTTAAVFIIVTLTLVLTATVI